MRVESCQVSCESDGAPGGIRTRQPANYKSAALPLRHWGIGEKKPKGSFFDSNRGGYGIGAVRAINRQPEIFTSNSDVSRGLVIGKRRGVVGMSEFRGW